MESKWGYNKDFEDIYSHNEDLYKRLSNKSILVTGATGLLGTCLTEYLLFLKNNSGIDIDITVLSSSIENIENRFSDYIKDRSINTLTQDIRQEIPDKSQFDYVVHAASVANPKMYEESPVDVIDITVQGTRNILEHSRKSLKKPRVLYVSSVEVYGETKNIENEVTEDAFGYSDPFKVRSSYTESKRLAETLCKAYHSQYDLDCVVARLSKTYGPSNSKSDSRVMAYILNTILQNKDITLNSDGSRVFSFCYVTDAMAALLYVLLKGKSGEVYNVADKQSTASLKEIANLSAKLSGVSVQLQPTNVSIVSKDTVVNSDKLEQLGWTPGTNIEDGLRKQYEALKH